MTLLYILDARSWHKTAVEKCIEYVLNSLLHIRVDVSSCKRVLFLRKIYIGPGNSLR